MLVDVVDVMAAVGARQAYIGTEAYNYRLSDLQRSLQRYVAACARCVARVVPTPFSLGM